jgi:hypothetical protein
MTRGQRIRRLANLINLSTPLGVAVAKLSGSPLSTGPRGLLIAGGYSWPLPRAAAFTLGNVVLYRAEPGTAGMDLRLLGHEEKHSTQYAWCMGLPFLAVYLGCAGWSLLRAGDPASRNFFERQAGLSAGGYHNSPHPAGRTSGGRNRA